MKRTLLTSLIILLSMLTACAASDDLMSESPGQPNDDVRIRAEDRLFKHDVAGANRIFSESLGWDPNDAYAQAGKAVTELLLIPHSSAVHELFQELGATRRLEVRDNAIYGEGGLFYLLARGIDFQDSENFPGIFTLLEDRLPWSSQTLSSAENFFGPLTRTIDPIMDRMVGVAHELAKVTALLDTAMSNSFPQPFLLPGEVFHDDAFNLVFNRTELAGLSALLTGVQGAVYFLSAYSWDFSLSEVLGGDMARVMPEDPLYVEGWEEADYQAAFLSPRMFREIRDGSRLMAAQEQFRNAFQYLRRSIEFGLADQSNDVFRWQAVSQDVGNELIELVSALELALLGPRALPFTVPATEADFSPLWDGERVLDAEIDWFEKSDEGTWGLADDAIRAFFIEGIFTPEFEPSSPPKLDFSEDSSDFASQLFGDFESDLRVSYF